MAYASLADMIDAHKKTVIEQLAKNMKARSILSYAAMPSDYLSNLFDSLVMMVTQYFRIGNPNEFRDYGVHLTETQIGEGRDPKDVVALLDSLFDIMRTLTEGELHAAEDAADRAKYLRRIEGARVLAEVTVNATALRQKKQQA